MPRLRSRPLAIASLILVIGAAAGYWAHGVYTRTQVRKTVVALVTDTSQRVRSALAGTAAGTPAARFEQAAEIDAHTAQVEHNYSDLQRLDPAAAGPIAEAADDYILTSREILRRIAISDRARLNLAVNSAALHDHMRSDRGEATWPREAVRLKGRVEQDYRDYRLAAQALAELLESLPASQARIAPHVGPAMLIEPTLVTSARAAVRETASRLQAAVEKLSNLEAYR
jgi:hypothetical protein